MRSVRTALYANGAHEGEKNDAGGGHSPVPDDIEVAVKKCEKQSITASV